MGNDIGTGKLAELFFRIALYNIVCGAAPINVGDRAEPIFKLGIAGQKHPEQIADKWRGIVLRLMPADIGRLQCIIVSLNSNSIWTKNQSVDENYRQNGIFAG